MTTSPVRNCFTPVLFVEKQVLPPSVVSIPTIRINNFDETLKKTIDFAKKCLDSQKIAIDPTFEEICNIDTLAQNELAIGPNDSKIISLRGRELVILNGHIYLAIATLAKGSEKKAEVALDLTTRELRVLLTSLAKYKPSIAEMYKEGRLLLDPRLKGHPNIVRCDHAEILDGRAYIVEEWCTGGEFFTLLADQRLTFDDATRLRYAREMSSALKAVHSMGVVHHDNKPENWLVQVDGNGKKTLKLCDFGLSMTREELKANSSNETQTGGAYKAKGCTWMYCAPEMIRSLNESQEYSKQLVEEEAKKLEIAECCKTLKPAYDVYGAASIFFMLFSETGQLPPWFTVKAQNKIENLILTMPPDLFAKKGKFSPKLTAVAPLIARMYDKNPETRITMEAVDRELEKIQATL